MSDLIIGQSLTDKWYTPTPLYKRLGIFFGHDWVDLAADREAIDYRDTALRPTWYNSHGGLHAADHTKASWESVSPYAGMFCNPPGGKDRLLKYRMFEQATERSTDEGRNLIWLIYNINSIQPMIRRFPIMKQATLLIFRERLEFEGSTGSGNFFGSAMLFFPSEPSEQIDRFTRMFNQYGNIY